MATSPEVEKRPEANAPEANTEVARGLIQLEEAFDIADGSESTERRRAQSSTPQPVIPRAITAPEIRNLQNAGISATDIFQHLLRLQSAGGSSGPAWSEEPKRKENRAVMPESVIENTVEAPEKQQPEPPPANASEEGELENTRGRPLRSFVRKLFGFDGGTKPSQANNRIYQLTPEYPIAQPPAPTILSRDCEEAVRSLPEQPAAALLPSRDREGAVATPSNSPPANPRKPKNQLPSRSRFPSLHPKPNQSSRSSLNLQESQT